ncbi:MAG: VOC family protein [Candidatus Udaeobacter sp.]
MKAIFKAAHGYQGSPMALPVANLDTALPFYESVLGFEVTSRGDEPYKSAVARRDEIEIGFAENGGDPSQDGCAFEVNNAEAAFNEFKSRGLNKELPDFKTEDHGTASFKVFYVIAPDSLCYWFGERQQTNSAE